MRLPEDIAPRRDRDSAVQWLHSIPARPIVRPPSRRALAWFAGPYAASIACSQLLLYGLIIRAGPNIEGKDYMITLEIRVIAAGEAKTKEIGQP